MSAATPLDAALDSDLLIEASAGTGKTYALTTLAARLVVEAELPIDRLLVVTFTVAATGELRARLRRVLLACAAASETAGGASVPREQGANSVQRPADRRQAITLIERWRRLGIADELSHARLAAASRDLDRANIVTIHGFCQRLLTEFAFDGSIPFGLQVAGDDADEVAAAVRDFWRRRVVLALPQQLQFAADQRFTLAAATDWVREHHARAGLRLVGADAAPDDLAQQQRAWRQAFDAARAAWKKDAAAFDDALDKLVWHKNSQAKIHATWRRSRQAFVEDDASSLALADARYLDRASLQRVLRQGQQLPALPLFERFDALGEAAESLGPQWLRIMRRDLLLHVRRLLRREAWETRRLSYNGLLTEAERALRGNRRLAQRVRERFPVALIDEFQDTDGLQAHIFRAIYPSPSASTTQPMAEGRVAIVGDPKQSIYGFRGADVFAYLEASQRFTVRPDQRLRLTTNYRSTPTLVQAINALFSRRQPFLLPEIEFSPSAWAKDDAGETDNDPVSVASSHATDGDERGLVLGETLAAAPLQLRLFARADAAPGRGRFQTIAADAAAAEIAALLHAASDGGATLHGRPLTGGDVAVLVRTRVQGRAVAQALRQRGVQSVEMSDDSIFKTGAADQLHRLLHALAVAPEARQLRGVLGLDLFALDMQTLARLTTDDRLWADWQQRFALWRGVWHRAGVATLIRHLLFVAPNHCAEHLLRHWDGARQLTNMLHLADLLREAETRERLSPIGLVDWLAAQRGSGGGDSAQLRLESDERLVKVLTVHRAKGLEFPLVFCPFAWYRRSLWPEVTATYHERYREHGEERYREVLDLAPTRDAHLRQQVEDHAEELRLLYVALTRAQYRCVVTWAQVKGAERAPLAWLLHAREMVADTPIAALRAHENHMRRLRPAAWQAEVMAFADANVGAVSASSIAPDEVSSDATPAFAVATNDSPSATAQTVEPTARRLHRRLRRVRQMTSYSALAEQAGAAITEPEYAEVERADHDQREDETLATEHRSRSDGATGQLPRGVDQMSMTLPQRQDAFTFPRGRRAGDCLHKLFEARACASWEDGQCERTLRQHGIDSQWATVARMMVDDVRATPLAPATAAWGDFRIADLDRPLAEMEFQLPVRLDRAELGRCLTAHGYQSPFPETAAEAKWAKTVDGYLRGFIDLVACHDGRWYILDYKSNWLGDSSTAYSPAAIRRTMRDSHYHLQYLLYLTALHRYLGVKLPDYSYSQHIGGAFYLFVRGMAPDRPGHGVYYDLPAADCIEAIDNCFGTSP